MKLTTRGEATAKKLLDAALVVFARGGSAGLTVHAVVAESGVSLGSLYHRFGSFDGLARALFAGCLEEWLAYVDASLDGARSARSLVETIVASYLAFAEKEPDKARFVHASSYASFLPAGKSEVMARVAKAVAPIAAKLVRYVENGTIVALPPALLEVLVIGPAAEATRRWLAGDPALAPAMVRATLPARVYASVGGPRKIGGAPGRQAPLTTTSGTSRKTRATRSSSSSSTRRTSR